MKRALRDVIVLTAHGRGLWLCAQLEKARYNVSVIDVSALLGFRTVEDRLGPFGYFKNPLMSISEEQWLRERSQRQEQGFAIWTQEGLLESQGMLMGHQWPQVPQPQISEVMTALLSTVDDPCLAPQVTEAQLGSFYYIPAADDDYSSQDNERHIVVKEQEEVQFAVNGARKVFSFKENVEEAGVLVNFLTSAEASHLFPFTSSELLFSEPLEPKAVWLRSTVSVETSLHLATLPLQTLFVSRFDNPWLEENILILKKQKNKNYFSVWLKTWYRAARGTMDMGLLSEAVLATLEEYFPHSRAQMVEPFLDTSTAHRPPMYPVFDREEWEQQEKFVENGIVYGGPEKWKSYALQDRFFHEKKMWEVLQAQLLPRDLDRGVSL